MGSDFVYLKPRSVGIAITSASAVPVFECSLFYDIYHDVMIELFRFRLVRHVTKM